MPVCYITRKEHFNAAHRLYVSSWSEAENEAVFGKCANANYHGHNFTLLVTVKGEPHPITGFIIDLKRLSEIIKSQVVDELDHRNLNLDVAWLQGIQPSIENIVVEIWKRIAAQLPSGVLLHTIRLVETENNWVDYYGE